MSTEDSDGIVDLQVAAKPEGFAITTSIADDAIDGCAVDTVVHVQDAVVRRVRDHGPFRRSQGFLLVFDELVIDATLPGGLFRWFWPRVGVIVTFRRMPKRYQKVSQFERLPVA